MAEALSLLCGPSGPLALWQWLRPVHLPPTIWVWGDRVHGRPPAPLSNLLPLHTLTSPQASCSGPRICTVLPGGPQDAQSEPFTHRSTQTLSEPLRIWKRRRTHGYTAERSHTHACRHRARLPALLSQAQVFPKAPYNGLSSQRWDTNRWRCFLY